MKNNPNDLTDKVPIPQLREAIRDAMAKIPLGTRWQHYRGTEYTVLALTVDKNTNELRVLYTADANPDIRFDCLIAEWLEPVSTAPGSELGAIPEGKVYEGPRFTRMQTEYERMMTPKS